MDGQGLGSCDRTAGLCGSAVAGHMQQCTVNNCRSSGRKQRAGKKKHSHISPDPKPDALRGGGGGEEGGGRLL